jgi:hypothetical protein
MTGVENFAELVEMAFHGGVTSAHPVAERAACVVPLGLALYNSRQVCPEREQVHGGEAV